MLLTEKETLQADMLARIQALKKIGIYGWQAALQAVDDYQREQQLSEQERQIFTRVEAVFNHLDHEEKETLFWIAEKLMPEISVEMERPFADFLPSERTALANALRRATLLRNKFPQNLRSHEFHPKGARKW